MNPTRHRQGVMGIWHLAVYNNQFHYNLFTVRLCLVAVKRFPENTYFPEMLISRKGKYFSVFGCISKNFPENIFWCLEKKKENTNPRKISSTIAISSARSRDQRRELATARDRDLRRELATVRDRAVNRDLREIAPPRAWTGDRRRLKLGLEIGAAWRLTDCSISSPLFRVRALSLSLSLFFRKCFEVKMRGENHFRVKSENMAKMGK